MEQWNNGTVHLAFTTTKHKQILDITDDVNAKLATLKANEGLCHLFLLHTTAALTTADLDPGTDLDMLDAFEAMIPTHSTSSGSPIDTSESGSASGRPEPRRRAKLRYRHPHDPSHVGDHIMSSVIGPSVLLPFAKGALILGTWQRVVLVELDGPREREMVLIILPSGTTSGHNVLCPSIPQV